MSSPTRTIRILFAVILFFAGFSLVILEKTVGTLGARIGQALIVAGVVAIFHETVLRKTEIRDTVEALRTGLVPHFTGISKEIQSTSSLLAAQTETAKELNKKLHLLTPDLIDSFHRAKSDPGSDDLLLAKVADAIYDNLRPAFDALSHASTLNDDLFFQNAGTLLNSMRSGDRILAICCRKSWENESRELVERYWELNRDKAAEGVSVRRVFISDAQTRDDPDFGDNLLRTIEKHKSYKHELRALKGGDGLQDNMQIRKIGRRLRDNLSLAPWLDPLFGFALLSSRQRKVVSLHRLVGSHLKGTLVENPLVYAVLERFFWEIWKQGEPI